MKPAAPRSGTGLVFLVVVFGLAGCSSSVPPEQQTKQVETEKQGKKDQAENSPKSAAKENKITPAEPPKKEDNGAKITQAKLPQMADTDKKDNQEDPSKKPPAELPMDSFRITGLSPATVAAENHKAHHGALGNGGIQVAFAGQKFVSLKLEIWEQGQLRQFTPHTLEKSLTGGQEFCFSVQRSTAEKGKNEEFQIVYDTEVGYNAYKVPAPKVEPGKLAYTAVTVRKEMVAKDGTFVPAWLFAVTKEGVELPPDLSLEELAGRTEWAFLVQATVTKDQKPLNLQE